MSRVLAAILLWFVLAIFALIALAVAFGDLTGRLFLVIWALGAVGILAGGIAFGLPGKLTRRLLTHAALVLGCIVFSFPFLWLISTSFKYNEEMFVYPPKWIPTMPRHVLRSPYVSAEICPPIKRPEGMDEDRWQTLWPKLAEAVFEDGRRLLSDQLVADLDADDLRRELTHALYQAAAAGVAEDLWTGGSDEDIVAAVRKRIDAQRVGEVWSNIHRCVALRDVRVQDTDLNEYALAPSVPAPRPTAFPATHPPTAPASRPATQPATGPASRPTTQPATRPATRPAGRRPAISYVGRWTSRTQTAECTVRPIEPIRPGTKKPPKPTAVVSYDFAAGNSFELTGEFPLPEGMGDLLQVIVPIRQDRSWHPVRFELEVGGVRYVTEDSMYLGQYRWQEVGLRLKHLDSDDNRDQGIWPLVRAEDQSGPPMLQPNTFRLRIVVEKSSRVGAIWHKYTDSFRRAYIATPHRWHYVWNSFYLVAMNVLGQLVACSLVAYAFARLHWPGRDFLFAVMLATMMLPPQVTMIPVFLIFKNLGWYNTLRALWVPSFMGGAFFIFMLRQFMRGIPTELEDAAKIDGCGFFGVYWRIILPLMKPALAAVAIFTFMATWNNFMGPLIYINDQRLYPLALGLFDFRSQHGAEFNMLMAASTMMTLPVVALFFLAQKYFIQGVTLTGLKG